MTIFRVVLSGTLMGTNNQNVMNFKKDNAVWPGDGQALSVAIRDSWVSGANGIRQGASTLQNWNLIQVYNRSAPGDPAVALAINLSGTKVGNGSQGLPFTAILLRVRGSTGGKHGRGRIYLPGVEPTQFGLGVMTSSAQTTIWNPIVAQLLSSFVTGGGSTGFALVIAPKTGDGANSIVCSTIAYDTICRVQRSRNIGVGI